LEVRSFASRLPARGRFNSLAPQDALVTALRHRRVFLCCVP
jgi:hypothetical protein